MERFAMQRLIDWKSSPARRPLILNGARQVGKTWLIKEFAEREYASIAYVNLENNEAMAQLFEGSFEIPRIISGIELETGIRIEPDTTLIALDEIQEVPKALTSLKYFYENAPQYHIIAAGSLLGIQLHQGTSFPVGKVDTVDIYPLSFEEYVLQRLGRPMLDTLMDADPSLAETFKTKLTATLKDYYFVGGMPEAINAFGQDSNYGAARSVQRRILADYERDFSKHQNARDAERAFAVWESIPAHLAQENKRFVFGKVAKGGRAKEFEHAITWLAHAGLLYKVPRVSKPALPLNAYAGTGAFKAFILDVGLLGAMCQTDARSVIEGNKLFTEFKGAQAEQFVCQQLIAACGLRPFYWSAENSRGEIDFLTQSNGDIYAIEVKAEENLKAKSLRSLKQKYPDIHAVRFSLSGYREESWMKNVPLYLMGSERLWSAPLEA